MDEKRHEIWRNGYGKQKKHKTKAVFVSGADTADDNGPICGYATRGEGVNVYP